MSEKPPCDLPHFLEIGRHRDRAGRGRYQWIKRGIITLFVVFIAAAFFNVFGQRAVATTTSASGTTLRLTTPRALRLGLIYQTSIDITSAHAIHTPVMVLSSGWFDGATLNSSEPSAVAENHRPAGVAFAYSGIPRGGHVSLWFQWSVNPRTPFGTARSRFRCMTVAINPCPHHPRHRVPIIMDLVVRCLILFPLVLILTRVVTRRELRSLEPFDLVLLVVLGDMLQQGITQNDQSVTGRFRSCSGRRTSSRSRRSPGAGRW